MENKEQTEIKGRWKQNYRDNCPECKRYSLYVCDKKGTNSHVRRYKSNSHVRRYKCRNCGYTDFKIIK
jgi:hypothetical protein